MLARSERRAGAQRPPNAAIRARVSLATRRLAMANAGRALAAPRRGHAPGRRDPRHGTPPPLQLGPECPERTLGGPNAPHGDDVSGRVCSPVRLTRSRRVGADPSDVAAISFQAVCTRQIRDVVLVVHAEHGETLPVLVDGKAVSSTDTDGVSHVLLHFDRDVRSFGVVLDTSARRDLRPQNPSRNFDLTGRDAIVLFEPTLAPASRVVARQAVPVRHIPHRVD
jgi:hypothetical protein